MGDITGPFDSPTSGVARVVKPSAFTGESGTDELARCALTSSGCAGVSGPQPLSVNPATTAVTAATPIAARCQVCKREGEAFRIVYLRFQSPSCP